MTASVVDGDQGKPTDTLRIHKRPEAGSDNANVAQEILVASNYCSEARPMGRTPPKCNRHSEKNWISHLGIESA